MMAGALAIWASPDSPKGMLTATYSEDFSGLTAGIEDVPDIEEISVSGKVDPALTHGDQWLGRGLHAAGETMAVLHFEQKDWFGTESVQGYVQTPYIDVRLDEGQFLARFRARTLDVDSATVYIEVYDPYTTNSISSATVRLTGDWATYEVPLSHPGYGNHLAYLQMTTGDEDWQFDDFEIVQDYYGLVAPIVHFPRNVTFEQFTGRWNAAPLAEGYYVSAFSYDDSGQPVYLLKDEYTTECTMTVQGTVKGTDYYYTVSSANSLYRSEESEPRKVNVPLSSLDTPVVLEAADISDFGFTARWEPVFRAMGYIVNLQREHLATEDEEFTVLCENFDKFSYYEDYSAPFYGNLDDYTAMPGWSAPNWPVYTEGMFGLDNYWNRYDDIFLSSPVLDLSGDGGRFTLHFEVYGTAGDTMNVVCGDSTLTHTLEVTGLQEFELVFENGSLSTQFTIRFDGSGYLFFDEISVSQTIHAGDAIREQVGTFNTDRPVSEYAFDNLEAVPGDVFVYYVTAWAYSLDEDGVYGPNVYSEASELQRVTVGTVDVESVSAKIFKAIAVDGCIEITVSEACDAEIYRPDGSLCSKSKLNAGVNRVPLSARGMLLVCTPEGCAKVIVR